MAAGAQDAEGVPPISVPTAAIPAAPPTSPGGMIAKRPRTWHIAVGCASLAVAACGVISGLFAVITMRSKHASLRTIPELAEVEFFESHQYAVAITRVVLAVMLGVAGVLLLRRLAVARQLLLIWCCVEPLRVIYALTIDVVVERSMRTNFWSPPGRGWWDSVGLVMFVVVALLSFAFPVALWIILRRPTIRSDIDSWRSQSLRPVA